MNANRSLEKGTSCCIVKTCSPGEFWVTLNMNYPPNALENFVEGLNQHASKCVNRLDTRITYDIDVPEVGALLAVKFEESEVWRAAVCTDFYDDSKGRGPEVVFLDSGELGRLNRFDYEILDDQFLINGRIEHFLLYNVIPVNNTRGLPWSIKAYSLVKELLRCAHKIFIVPMYEERRKGVGKVFGYLYLSICGEIKDVRQMLLENEYCIEDEPAFCRTYNIDPTLKTEVNLMTLSISASQPTPVSSLRASSSSSMSLAMPEEIDETERKKAEDIRMNEILSKFKTWGDEPLSSEQKYWILQKDDEERNISFSNNLNPCTPNPEIQETEEDSISTTSISQYENEEPTKLSSRKLKEILIRKLNVSSVSEVRSWLEEEKLNGGDVCIVMGTRFIFVSPSDLETNVEEESAQLNSGESSPSQEVNVSVDESIEPPADSKVCEQNHNMRRALSANDCTRAIPSDEIDARLPKLENSQEQRRESQVNCTSTPPKGKSKLTQLLVQSMDLKENSEARSCENKDNADESEAHCYKNKDNADESEAHSYKNKDNADESEAHSYKNKDNTEESEAHSCENKDNTEESEVHSCENLVSDNKAIDEGRGKHSKDNLKRLLLQSFERNERSEVRTLEMPLNGRSAHNPSEESLSQVNGRAKLVKKLLETF